LRRALLWPALKSASKSQLFGSSDLALDIQSTLSSLRLESLDLKIDLKTRGQCYDNYRSFGDFLHLPTKKRKLILQLLFLSRLLYFESFCQFVQSNVYLYKIRTLTPAQSPVLEKLSRGEALSSSSDWVA
jgi:hypothetical protein